MNVVPRVYQALVRVEPSTDERSDPDDDVSRRAPGNGLRIIGASALQNVGDQVVNAKTVLPWLLSALGAPGFLIGLLVPVRESGALLPQAAMAARIRRRRLRKWVWVGGALGQAVATAGMALTAAVAEGLVAGLAIVGALAVFALARAATSITSKDVLGRTIPKGQRGQINGIATVASGVVAITVGIGIRLLGGDRVGTAVLAWLLAAATLAWVVAALVYATVREPAGQTDTTEEGWAAHTWSLLRDDAAFRRFVLVRTLLLVSALSPPFVVMLAARHGDTGLSGLGPFVISSGLASLAGRRMGRLADRSSRRLMMAGAATASVIVLALLAALALPTVAPWSLLYPIAYLLLALTHTAIRVARKTYVVDMATGNRRTDYVAVANTAMGVLLLVAGAISSALAHLGPEVALGFLAVLGLAGVAVGKTLPEVSQRP